MHALLLGTSAFSSKEITRSQAVARIADRTASQKTI